MLNVKASLAGYLLNAADSTSKGIVLTSNKILLFTEAASSGKGGGRLGEGGRLTGKVVSMSLGGHKFEGCI